MQIQISNNFHTIKSILNDVLEIEYGRYEPNFHTIKSILNKY